MIAFLFARIIKKSGLRLLSVSGLVRENYVGKKIPTSTGVIFAVSAFFASTVTASVSGLTCSKAREVLPCLILVVGSSLIGLIDDVLGSHATKGLMGHVKVFADTRIITTGLLKAVIIWLLAAFAVIIAAEVRSPLALVFDATLIGLAANFINLLDLQPARSVKGFFISMALLIACDYHSSVGLVSVGLAGAVLSGLGDELREQCMIGDAGSNPLGAALGYWAALRLSLTVKTFVLFFLVGVHAYSEQRSLSKAIDGNSVLRFIDKLGRS